MPTAKSLAEEGLRALSDRMYLAREVLGYDFTEETHRELFRQYPPFEHTDEKAWASQFPKRDVLILWSRGHFKSTAIVVLAVEAILKNPDIRIMLMQGTVKVTKNLLAEIAAHFTGAAPRSRLVELFPEFCGDKKTLRLSANQFTTPARRRQQLPQATVTVASPRATKTGQHYDLGFFDDLVNAENYRNPEVLAKVEQDFNMCLPLIDPGCPRFVSGTRYAFGDLYENIIRRDSELETKEWAVSLKTCWADGCFETVPRFPLTTTADGRVVGFTREMLLAIKRDTPDIYASQYLNQPVSVSAQVITELELAAAVVSPLPALSSAVLFVDLAAESRTGRADDSVIVAGKIDALGKMYAIDLTGGQWTVAQLALQVIEMALKHRPLRIMIEETASAKYFTAYLSIVCKDKGVNLPIDYIKVDNRPNAKNIRVQAASSHVKNRRLFFAAALPQWDKLVEQWLPFPKGRYGHDDYPDTIALMCQYFAINYVGLAPVQTKHPVVAMLDRDPFVHLDSLGVETLQADSTMGSEFV